MKLFIIAHLYLFLQVKRPWNVYSGTMSRDFNLLVTPKVKEEVRTHFGCADLEGAELEDQVVLTC